MADLTALKEAGMDVDSMSEAERAAIATLDQSEIDTLVAIRNKLNANMPDVTGYLRGDGTTGNFVW